MLKFILYALLIWFLYNLIFRLIIPVYRASRQMRRKFRDMQERVQQQQQQQQQASANQESRPQPQYSSTKAASDDYIEFEEIK